MTSDDIFTAPGGGTAGRVDTLSNTALSATSDRGEVTFSYDATNGVYKVLFGDEQSFGAADAIISPVDGAEAYQQSASHVTNTLVLITKNRWTDVANQYVGAGFWQRTMTNGSGLDEVMFASFLFGQPTAPSAIPTNGQVYFLTDVHGRVTSVGGTPMEIDGSDGYFIVDLGLGTFLSVTNLTETDPVGGGGVVGSIYLRAGGLLTSNGAFEGTFFYSGYTADVGGTITGAFYGPNAEEVGATFSGATADGAAISGAITGQQDSSPTYINTRLDQLTVPETFFIKSVELVIYGGSGALNVSTAFREGNIGDFTGGEFGFSPPNSLFYAATFSDDDIVDDSDPDFVHYQTTVNGEVVQVALARLGDPNAQVELTYTGFGMYQSASSDPTNQYLGYIPFVYGIESPAGAIARTGSARYTGVVYGVAAKPSVEGIYEVNGTSTFDVDFTSQSINGYLVLDGTRTDAAGSIDFGQFNFSAALASQGSTFLADFTLGSDDLGDFEGTFYGPYAQEIGGRFSITSDGYKIAGVAAAKQN